MISAELGSQLESYVADLVAHGRYGSKSEVLREGVRLVQDLETRRTALAAILDQALAESDAGLGVSADEIFDRLEAKYRKLAK
ncbi:MAG: type II toxin-antitoxin system ParD family antitoxin [Propionibacteriaceae bacterium]|jgi:antitoxin ParD1/3/4|nr:type II toxin-antitoxin system ParD family antitoxin [Propionibacteriaceae bacterium]